MGQPQTYGEAYPSILPSLVGNMLRRLEVALTSLRVELLYVRNERQGARTSGEVQQARRLRATGQIAPTTGGYINDQPCNIH